MNGKARVEMRRWGGLRQMYLYEFQAKALCQKQGIRVPNGYVAAKPDDCVEPRGPVVVKSQVLIGSRGKDGGILIAEDRGSVVDATARLIGSRVRGHLVNRVLIEEKIEHAQELYLALVVDASGRRPVFLFSRLGGVDIESVPKEGILTVPVDYMIGVRPYMARDICVNARLPRETEDEMFRVMRSMYEIFVGKACEMVEINPLAVVPSGGLVALDAKIALDDRGGGIPEEPQAVEGNQTLLESELAQMGLFAVQMDGDVVVVTGGAGVAMATADAILARGASIGAVVDIGGVIGHDVDKASRVLSMFDELKARVIVFNFYANVTALDKIAEAIRRTLPEFASKPKVVVRLKGYRAVQGLDVLKGSGVFCTEDFDEACERAVRESGR